MVISQTQFLKIRRLAPVPTQSEQPFKSYKRSKSKKLEKLGERNFWEFLKNTRHDLVTSYGHLPRVTRRAASIGIKIETIGPPVQKLLGQTWPFFRDARSSDFENFILAPRKILQCTRSFLNAIRRDKTIGGVKTAIRTRVNEIFGLKGTKMCQNFLKFIHFVR